MVVRVLIAEYDPVLRNQIKEMVQSDGEFEIAGVARDGQEAIQVAMEFAPHIALISYDLPGISGLKTCEILNALSPDLMSVLICEKTSQDCVDNAMRSGAHAFLKSPFDADKLGSLIAELAEIRLRRYSDDFLQWKDHSRFPKIISITGARGGVGKTTISANLAAILAKRLPDQVVLVDLYTQFGDIATAFDIKPKGALVDIAPVYQEIDADLIQDYVTKHPSGVHILITSPDPLPLDSVSVECLDNLLYALKQTYRYIIIDVPPILHETSLHVLAHSNLVLLATNMSDFTTIADTRKFYDAIKYEHISRENVKVVLNRVSSANQLHASDVDGMFDCGVIAHIPEDNRLVAAANQGIPMVLTDGDSPFKQSISRLAKNIIRPEDASDEEVTPSRTGFLGMKLWSSNERIKR